MEFISHKDLGPTFAKIAKIFSQSKNADFNMKGGRSKLQPIDNVINVHIGDDQLIRKIRRNLGTNFAKFS